ncbi:DUF2975 domain-containing protein [Ruminococcus sp.]
MINKNIKIIKRSSLVILILSVLGAVLSVIVGISFLTLPMKEKLTKDIYIGQMLSYCIQGAILVLAAIVFFRIFRSNRPFTRGNIWAIRGIAGLFLLKALILIFTKSAALGTLKAGLNGLGSAFICVLFLFFAEIMRYGRLLQTESDETL